MPTTICHLITSLGGGGTENFLYQVISASPRSFQHDVLFLKDDGVTGDRLRALGIRVRRAPAAFGLWRLLRQERPAILHTCLYRAHLLGRLVGRAAGIPFIVSSQRSIDTTWARPWQRKLDAWTTPWSHCVITNSAAAEHLVLQRIRHPGRPRVVRIPNGVSLETIAGQDRFQTRPLYHLPPDAIVGGSLLRLHAEKGADLIPAFAARLLPGWPRLHLLVGGTGPLEDVLKKQTASAPYKDRIYWVGWQNDIGKFLSACDFFWLLSREESFPQTLVEASAAGLPWVAPHVGGVPELVSSGAVGSLFPPGDLEGAQQKVNALIEHLGELTDRARSVVPALQTEYSLAKMIQRVYQVFEQGNA